MNFNFNFKEWLKLQEKKLTKDQRKRVQTAPKERPLIFKSRVYT
jgi:hypothetical protein